MVESEIARVDALLRQLVGKRRHLKHEINARFAPILRLPPEMLSEISNKCLSSNVWDDDFRFISPLIFGKVCSSWRSIAFSTPRLWSSMQLNDERDDLRPALVEQWLQRSRKMPLSIYAVSHLISPSPTEVAIFHVIARNAERWFYVAFDLSLP